MHPGVDRALARPLPRRRAPRAPRPARHARADLVRAHVPGAGGRRRRRRSTSRPGSSSGSRRPTRTTFPLLPLARAAGERGGTFPCAYNAANEVAVAAFLDGRIGFLEIADIVAGVARARRRRSGARSRRSRRRGRRGAPRCRAGGSSPHDDLRRDRRARAARLRPRARALLGVARAAHAPAEVLHRVPTGGRQAHAERDRVRHRDDPARRLREDPGHAPAGAGRRRPCLRPRGRGGTGARRPGRPPAPRARRRRSRRRPRGARRRSPSSPRSSRSRSRPRAGVEKGVTDIGDALGPDAYWRARHVEARARDLRRPGGEHPLRGRPLHRALHDLGRQGDDDGRQRPRRHRRCRDRAPGGRPDRLDQRRADDRRATISRHDLGARTASRSPSSSSATATRVTLGPRPAEHDGGVYRLGFILRGRRALAAGRRARESARVTGARLARTSSTSLGNLVTGEGRKDISSPVGIVQGSSDAAKQGTDSFLWVLGLISLSIALLNLLPFLPLDGGHIVFAIVEGIRGRAVTREVYERVSIVGIGLVLLLFVIGLTNDIGRSRSVTEPAPRPSARRRPPRHPGARAPRRAAGGTRPA